MKWIQFCLFTFAALIVAVAVATADEGESWQDRLTIQGDMRFRYEWIDQQDKPDERERFRLRARLEFRGRANDDVDMIIRAASGSDDPVSSNQSFSGGFSTKDFRLDRAYIDYHPSQVNGLALWLGKTEMPFVTIRDLIWDDDLNPEGMMVVYKRDVGEFRLFLNGGWWWAEERAEEDDTVMWGAQAGGSAMVRDRVSILGGASYYGWENTKGFSTLFVENEPFGNTVVDVGTPEAEDLRYVNEYRVFNVFGKLDLKTDFVPLALYADYIVNTDADTPGDTGFMVGGTIGKAKDPGSWQFDYNYRDLEADATIGAFTDSDSFGGGTDGKGHKFQAKYQLAKNWQTAASFFLQQIDPAGADVDFNRLQLDLIAKF